MSDAWYHLLRCVHYLGYHTADTMSYTFDRARLFTLVTSNEAEVREIEGLLKESGKPKARDAAIWVIEGRAEGNATVYRLREVFHPREVTLAQPEHTPGAKKKFVYSLDGKGAGKDLGESLVLNGRPWFKAFFEESGRFGFGLDHLRNPEVKEHFLELVRPFYQEST
ncbi:hypothetical protein SAMN00790413_02273 [Deinococcus hopiensis KR-140]|uniref:Uncharacterized protein n=2 Tax=Deinococcus TaxID=1298 RepID=A0A1W1VLG4_9DEIO|nr:hypothetical protein SAMN00790413_02273 [Deinococcus hopiensis KR-140]